MTGLLISLCWGFMASRRELFRPQIQEAILLQHGECDVIRRMATFFFTSEAQPCKSEFLLFNSGISLCSCKCGGCIVFPAGFDFHFITRKSLGFENQSFQGCSVPWVQWYGMQQWLPLCICGRLPRMAGRKCQSRQRCDSIRL